MGECAPPPPAAAVAKTSVWWDIDKCAVPRGRCDPYRIAHNVIAALAAVGYSGPVSIAAYGDAARVAPPVLHALSATGICLTHVPAGSKDTSDKRMLVDMLFWAFDNPPPGNYLVISGDRDFSDLLHRLRMKRYDILVVRPANASSQVLATAAKSVWLWESLATGEMLQPEPSPANSVLGCKLDVNDLDTLKRSQSKVRSDYGRDEDNANAGSQYRVKPLQKYVKKLSSASSSAGDQGRVESTGGVSESSKGSTFTELYQSSILPSSSSRSSDSPEKVNASVPLESPALAKSSDQNHVLSTQLRQVQVRHESILGEKQSTSTECMARNGIIGFGSSNAHYKQPRYSEAQHRHHSEFKIGDSNEKAANQHRVKPLQKYVKKANITSPESIQVYSVGFPDCPVGSTTSELIQSSVSVLSSSETLKVAKVDNLGQPEMSTLPHSLAQKSVGSAHLHQMRAPHEFILGKKPSTSADHASRNGSTTSELIQSSVPVLSSSETLKVAKADNLGQPEMSTLPHSLAQKSVGSAYLHQMRAPHEFILGKKPSTSVDHVSRNGSTPSELIQSSVSVLSSSETLKVAKVDNLGQPEMSTLPHSSAQKSIASAHLHQMRAPHEFILGKKPSTSVDHASRNGTHGPNIGGVYHPPYQQCQSSEPLNKLQSYSNMGDNGGNGYKLNQNQVYVKRIDIPSAPSSTEIDPVNGFLDNPKGDTFGHPSQSMSASSRSKSPERTKGSQSSQLTNPLFSQTSAHKPLMTDHSHEEQASSIYSKEASTSVQFLAKNETFVFGASTGHYHPKCKPTQSCLLSEPHNLGSHHPPSLHGHSHSINSQRENSAPPSAGHNGVSSAQIQATPTGSTFEGLDDICHGISRLNISECSKGTGGARQPLKVAPTNDASMGMPDISGHSKVFPETKSSCHSGSNTNCYLNDSSDSRNGQLLSSEYTCRGTHPPNLSSDMQNPGHCEQKPGYLPDSSEPAGAIRNILHALGTLKTEKIFPTESNIADCICYGEMSLIGFDVKKALELAIRHQAVVMKKLVNDMPLFVAKDESLWKCVNVTNSKSKNPIEELERVHKYISSTKGHSAIKNSQSRYQAAMILKKSCLQHCALGEVLQVLHIAIARKKWLVPHSSGWQPLSLNTTVVTATTDATAEAKS
ncbi:hypothetical protein ACP4OV_012525 [Aristida adscensionis]